MTKHNPIKHVTLLGQINYVPINIKIELMENRAAYSAGKIIDIDIIDIITTC